MTSLIVGHGPRLVPVMSLNFDLEPMDQTARLRIQRSF
jgi:hypothetical protein